MCTAGGNVSPFVRAINSLPLLYIPLTTAFFPVRPIVPSLFISNNDIDITNNNTIKNVN